MVALLLDAGADRRIPTGAGQLAEQLTAKPHIRRILGGTAPSSRSRKASSPLVGPRGSGSGCIRFRGLGERRLPLASCPMVSL